MSQKILDQLKEHHRQPDSLQGMGVSGMVHIHIKKANGSSVKYSIRNTIDSGLYTQLASGIASGTHSYSSLYVPEQLKVTLSGAQNQTFTTSSTVELEKTKGDWYLNYKIKDAVFTDATGTSPNCYPSTIELKDVSGGQQIAYATDRNGGGTGTTYDDFTWTQSGGADATIDANDEVDITYTLNFAFADGNAVHDTDKGNSFKQAVLDRVQQGGDDHKINIQQFTLLGGVTTTNAITNHTDLVSATKPLTIVSTGAYANRQIEGLVSFSGVSSVPTGLAARTPDGKEASRHQFALSSFVNGDNVSINKYTYYVLQPGETSSGAT